MTPPKAPWQGELNIHPLANIFPYVEGKRRDELLADIREHGLADPIVIDGGLTGNLIDGRNRLEVCFELGIPPKFAEFSSLNYHGTVEQFILSKNTQRRDLTPLERARIAVKAKKYFADQAKQRQRQHGGTAPGRPKTVMANSPEVSGTTREQMANEFDTTEHYIRQVEMVEKDPELKEQVDTSKTTISQAVKKVQEKKRKAKTEPRKAVDDEELGQELDRANRIRYVTEQFQKLYDYADAGKVELANNAAAHIRGELAVLLELAEKKKEATKATNPKGNGKAA